MKLAVVFPGQASQYIGMGKALAEAFPEAMAVFDEARGVLGSDFVDLLWNGPEEALNLTANTQPGVLTASIAAWRALIARKPDLVPSFVAGHSLGEYSAHVAVGTFSFKEALSAVRQRGVFMQEAVPVGVGAMAALMGIEAEAVAAVCAEAAQGEVVSPANDNALGQIVIAGHAKAVERAVALAKNRGCKKAVLLPVSAPFHCALMRGARAKMEPVLDAMNFRTPRFPVAANVDAAPVQDGEGARSRLKAQVDNPVRWRETMLFLQAQGVDTILETGPGSVLCGLAKRASKDWKLLHIEDPASLEEALSALAG